MEKTEITPNKRLTNAYQVVSQFDTIPQFRTYQEQLIRIFYSKLKKGKGKTRPLSELDDEQIFSVAESLFNTAYKLMNTKTSEEKTIIKSLFLLEQALRDKRDTETLDERICIQLEAFPEDSDLVQEYNAIKNY